ncbi:hypothetical protein F2Q69_00048789 [Brassica cretica]|uniref:Uncharacterized protein n=1 Tax=Brassica cretica TaxID=69181 RepID=A0A8S9PM43_BRACR|nr:hypothetical protein F2Q69_00048789 [Brassica cretica]
MVISFSRISTLVVWYDSYDNIVDLRWIVKIPALSDDEERQLRRRFLLHISVLLQNTNKSKDDSITLWTTNTTNPVVISLQEAVVVTIETNATSFPHT